MNLSLIKLSLGYFDVQTSHSDVLVVLIVKCYEIKQD